MRLMAQPTPRRSIAADAGFSSSPAFATPAHPIPTRLRQIQREPRAAVDTSIDIDVASSPPARPAPVLSISLPAATLRPIAFRTFTKKHNLTLTSSALQSLATFVGKHCGSQWREESLAEGVLEEAAKAWKKGDGTVIVDTQDGRLANILKQIEGSMIGGRLSNQASIRGLSRENSAASDMLQRISSGLGHRNSVSEDSLHDGAGEDASAGDEELVDEDISKGVRPWLQVISAFDQPALLYNPGRKHFERSASARSLLPPISHKTDLMRQRYHLIHQGILRNESFQASSVAHAPSRADQTWRLTSIANLLGRTGTGHLILGLLQVSPTGQLALSDLTGTVILDLSQASPIDEVETWICPGMVVLIDGVYEEQYGTQGGGLAGAGGIGGTVSGRFVGFSVGAPRCETRTQSLGLSEGLMTGQGVIGGGFGWVDFLGVGSERAVGARMKRIEHKVLIQEADQDSAPKQSPKVVMVGQVTLDDPLTLAGLRKLFARYSAPAMAAADSSSSSSIPSLPTAFVLFGSFISQPAMSNLSSQSTSHGPQDTSSVAYKECFDALASLLHDFPTLLRQCTFIFVPGDNDAWASSFSAGASATLPHPAIPAMFTTRVNREFTAANSDHRGRTRDGSDSTHGQSIWTSNPSRVSVFGPLHEIVLFRDDASGRLRRNSVTLKSHANIGDEGDPLSDSGISMSGERNSSPPVLAHEDEIMLDPDEQAATTATVETLDPKLQQARKLTKSLLDQANLSPYLLDKRPLHWSYGHALSLYPLPSALVLCDPEAEPFCLVYQGCCTINTGRITSPVGTGSARSKATWIEYDLVSHRGDIQEALL